MQFFDWPVHSALVPTLKHDIVRVKGGLLSFESVHLGAKVSPGKFRKEDDAMDMEKLVSLCKRRGFIFPSSEIYGGLNGFWDYGPLGVELKRNIKDAWWRDNVMMRDDMVGLDSSIIMNPRVWEASGHVGGFSDPMSTCRQYKKLFRADQVWDQVKESDWLKSLPTAFPAVPDRET